MGAELVILRKEDHSYEKDGKRVSLCVSDVLELSGIKQPYPPQAAGHVMRARELGETVHEWCQYLDEGGNDVSSLEGSDILPFIVGYQKFREKHCPNWLHIENSFADEDIDCAGTPDRIGTMDDLCGNRPLVILDIKTPKKDEHYWGIQLSAYEHLSGYEAQLLVLRLFNDGTYALLNYESQINVFLGAVAVAKWRLRNGAKRNRT